MTHYASLVWSLGGGTPLTGTRLRFRYDGAVAAQPLSDVFPRLRRPPLVEALIEVQFPRAANFQAYGSIPGQLYGRLRNEYPKAEDLPAADLPLRFDQPVVRHRFSSQDGSRLFQVGNGVLSVNSLAYVDYPTFRTQVEQVLAEALPLFASPARIALRYINRLKAAGEPIDKVLDAEIRIAPMPPGELTRQQFAFTFDIGADGQLEVVCMTPVEGYPGAILLDLTATKEQPPANLDELLDWIEVAHGHIETLFRTTLKSDFLETLA